MRLKSSDGIVLNYPLRNVTPLNLDCIIAVFIADNAFGRTKLRRYANTTRRLGAVPSNGMILKSIWSFSVSAVAGNTLIARPLATIWRIVLIELPCNVLVKPCMRCLAANSEQLDNTWSRIQFPSVSNKTCSSPNILDDTASRSSNGCPWEQ